MTPRQPVQATERKKISRHDRAVVFLRQDGKCAGCGAKLFRPYIVDHVIQLWMGGADDPSNMQAVCRDCDAPKTAKDATDRAKVKRLIKKADPDQRRSKHPIHGRNDLRKHPTLKRGFDGKVRQRSETIAQSAEGDKP